MSIKSITVKIYSFRVLFNTDQNIVWTLSLTAYAENYLFYISHLADLYSLKHILVYSLNQPQPPLFIVPANIH